MLIGHTVSHGHANEDKIENVNLTLRLTLRLTLIDEQAPTPAAEAATAHTRQSKSEPPIGPPRGAGQRDGSETLERLQRDVAARCCSDVAATLQRDVGGSSSEQLGAELPQLVPRWAPALAGFGQGGPESPVASLPPVTATSH